jgi:aldose 1-epimerase
MTDGRQPFGTIDEGGAAGIYFLDNGRLRIGITDFGGRMVSIEAPDHSGKRDHVLLGFDSVSDYAKAGGAFGAILGRNANRIAGGRIIVDGKIFELSRNEGDSTLHGGKEGFDKKFWKVEGADTASIVLSLVSPDGDQGFPGEVDVQVTYELDETTLRLGFRAETTKKTPVTLSAHPYFNLGGSRALNIFDHRVTIAADRFLPTDAKQIPTGVLSPVDGTAFDFREPATIGERIRRPDQQLLIAKGFDHYFVLGEPADVPVLAARICHPPTGRTLEILTTQRGTQFYTGNHLDGSVAGRGGAYRQSAGFAFEPQGFPDAPNQPGFPTTLLSPGTIYRESIWYRFGIA